MAVKDRAGRYFGKFFLASDAIKAQGEFIKSGRKSVSLRGTPAILKELWKGPATLEQGREDYAKFMEGVRPSNIPDIRKSMLIATLVWGGVCGLMMAVTIWSLLRADSAIETASSLLSVIPIIGTLLMTALMWRRVKIIDMKRIVGLRELLA